MTVTLEELERTHVLRVLEEVGGNMSSAARLLGVDRRTIYRKIASYEKKGFIVPTQVQDFRDTYRPRTIKPRVGP